MNLDPGGKDSKPEFFRCFDEIALPVVAFDESEHILYRNTAAADCYPWLRMQDDITSCLHSVMWLVALRSLREGIPVSIFAEPDAGDTLTLSMIPMARDEGYCGSFCSISPRREALIDPVLASFLHDLKSPLMLAVAAADLALRDESLSDRTRRYISTCHANCTMLSSRIGEAVRRSDLFNLSEAHFETVELRSFFSELCASFARSIDGFDRTFTYVLPAHDILFCCDSALLRKAADNLFSNALQHGTGAIRLTLELDEAGAVLEVFSEGAPIPAERIPNLCLPFYSTASPAKPLSGLGLYLVHSIARRHGGTLDCIPCEQGNTFRLVLPFRREEELASVPLPFALSLRV